MAAVPTTTGLGYLMLGSDGGIFALGNAGFHGSLPGLGIAPASPIIDVAPGTAGYLMLGRDGGIFNFGQSDCHGALVGFTSSPAISVAVKEICPGM